MVPSDFGEPPGPAQLVCWTPNDGFTIRMTWKGRVTKTYVRANRGYRDIHFAKRLLRFGGGWSFGPDEGGFGPVLSVRPLRRMRRARHGPSRNDPATRVAGRRAREWLGARAIPIKLVHTPEHAAVADLRRLVNAWLVPIHTAHREGFAAAFGRAELHPDREWWRV